MRLDHLPAAVTVTQAATELQASRNTVLRLIREERLRAIRLGARAYRIPREALEELLSEEDPQSGNQVEA